MGEGRELPLRMLVEASSALAAGLYAYGWVIASMFYGQFDVAPEEVGIGFAFVTIRVFFVVAAVALAVVVVWTTLRRFGDRFASLTLDRATAGHAVPPVVMIIGAVLAAVTLGDPTDDPFTSVSLAAGVITAIVDLWIGPRHSSDDEPLRINVRGIARVLSWVVAVVVVFVAVILVPRSMTDALATSVRGGGEIEVRPLPGIAIVRVNRVRVVTADRTPIGDKIASGSCVALLGAAGGTTVLYSSDQNVVVRVPQDRVTLESPC